jgi:type IV pilus assembly protein PilX
MIALVFLVIMAMLGVTVANNTMLQERMAGNTRDRDLALQAAEAALRDAELRIADEAAFRDGAPDYVPTNGNDDAFWEACFAGAASPCAVKYTPADALPDTGTGRVAAQPQYIIEEMPPDDPVEIYRVTARAVGGSDQTIVILQAEYGYTPP